MNAPASPLLRELITPEGVNLKLILGDAGERVAAFFIDVLVILGLLVALTIGVVVLGLATQFHLTGIDAMGLIWILGFFLLRNFYFTSFELTARAATPGKRAVGLRVASRDGGPLTPGAVFVRNAMRELELFLPLSFMAANATALDAWISLAGVAWCATFVFFPLFNRDRLRVGDLLAGTWVVMAPRRILDAELGSDLRSQIGAQPRRIAFSETALDAYGIKELNILENVLRRKDDATMRAVAQRIRAKTGFQEDIADSDFLNAYYLALRGRLEGRLLFGKRRKDKFEKI